MMTDKEKAFFQHLGKVIAKRRINVGYKQHYMAEKLEIGVEAVSRIERGLISVSAYRLLEFADILNCSVVDLLQESGNRPLDQASQITSMLEKLEPNDRSIILDTVTKLYERMK